MKSIVESIESTSMLNVVVDISHHNQPVDFKAVKDDGILGVIHKATEGTEITDPDYQTRRPLALEAHFGVGGDGAAQAQYFLSVVKPGPGDLLVLDLEADTEGASMTLLEAEAFVTSIHDATGRWPGLYSGEYIKDQLGNPAQTVLSNCWLWLAAYDTDPVIPKAWKDWNMWQYTDGVHGSGPYTVSGIGNCDRDKFNGNLDALTALWHS